jgi:hypothetical protein
MSSESLKSHGSSGSPRSCHSSDGTDHGFPGVCVDELWVLLKEEKKARATLAQVTSLLGSASEVGKKVRCAVAVDFILCWME